MARAQVAAVSSSVDVGVLAFGRAPGQLSEVVQRLLRVLEEQGHSAEEHDVDVRIRHEADTPLLSIEVEVLAGECGHWTDVLVGVGRGRPWRVWCDLAVFHEGEHRAIRNHILHTWPAA